MILPPLFVGLTLLFWGWEAGLLPLGIAGALIVEVARVFPWRWDFSEKEMNRVWDFCVILFVGAAVYNFAKNDLVNGPMKFFPLMPAIFFPFVVASICSSRDTVRLSTYFLLLRKRKPSAVSDKPLGPLVPYWYFVVCVASAGVANARDIRFYIGVVVLGGWLLWMSRNRTAKVWIWAIILAIVSVLGFGGHVGLNRLQGVVEASAGRFFESLTPDFELSQTKTAIGSVGKLKMSGRIILRVQSDGKTLPPPLLRKASFSTYTSAGNSASWSAMEARYATVGSASDLTTWKISPVKPSAKPVTISMYLWHGMGILPVPNGPVTLENVLASEVQTNQCGSIRVRDAPPMLRYIVQYTDESTIDAPPGAQDLAVPDKEQPAVSQIASELNLAGRTPDEIVDRVDKFFRQNFSYSRYLKGAEYDPTGRNTPLTQFLLHDRAGHCEYFATAAVLILRQAGVSARYATGFAVPDEAGMNHVHLVRSRHAHAWTLAYVNGKWRDFDTTPGTWEKIEDEEKSLFQPFTDLLSTLWFSFTKWRYYGDRQSVTKVAAGIAVMLLAWLAWKVFARKRSVRLSKGQSRAKKSPVIGIDSEFYLIEKHLAAAGMPRQEGESVGEWLNRLERVCPPIPVIPDLHEIAALHYAYRFDPQGITVEQRQALKARAARWLESQGKPAGKPLHL